MANKKSPALGGAFVGASASEAQCDTGTLHDCVGRMPGFALMVDCDSSLAVSPDVMRSLAVPEKPPSVLLKGILDRLLIAIHAWAIRSL